MECSNGHLKKYLKDKLKVMSGFGSGFGSSFGPVPGRFRSGSGLGRLGKKFLG